MSRCEVGCRCCTVTEGGGDDAGVDPLGDRRGGEGGLEWEGVGLEPGEKGGFAKDAGVRELGGMDVCICGSRLEVRVKSRVGEVV